MNRQHDNIQARVQVILLLLAFVCTASAQTKWEPTGVWPFAYRNFRVASIYFGTFKETKTVVPANIHLGKHSLWFSKNDTLLEAIPHNLRRVEFDNGDTYYPLGEQNELALVLRQDTINGRVARLYQVWEPDMKAINQKARDQLSASSLLQGSMTLGILNSVASAVADNQDDTPEERPLPMTSRFFMQINGDTFIATEKNIVRYLGKDKKHEYLSFTRSAEIISTNASSMTKVWDKFIAPEGHRDRSR